MITPSVLVKLVSKVATSQRLPVVQITALLFSIFNFSIFDNRMKTTAILTKLVPKMRS